SASGYVHFANQAFACSEISCATGGSSFTTTATAAPGSRSPGAVQKRSSSLQPTVLISACATLCQRDALKRANDVVWTFFGKKTFVVARAEIPVRSRVVVVTIKSPNAAHHDQA